ncbi:MAG: DUF4430 domain-containing protein [Clostridia bacterium]|nr:DUF4430 domain-containing protein [Clostridia bacterium]MBR0536820.1 DUF4430 domain-containing protein [Clostridia bacterium]
MKKDLLVFAALFAAVALFLCFSDIQSVEDYYLLHIDDVTPESETVTVSIDCREVLQHLDELDPALKNDVPESGMLLAPTVYVLRPGDTAFDLLQRTVRHNHIQMEYQGADANVFGSAYVQGIGYLYEFSCGPQSGWLFRVNGKFPTKGCSACELKDGDVLEWVYTCSLDTWKAGTDGGEAA